MASTDRVAAYDQARRATGKTGRRATPTTAEPTVEAQGGRPVANGAAVSAASGHGPDTKRSGVYECGWCFGTGVHHYNTDDMDRLTMPCPNRDCPKSPDWWHAAAEANAEDEAREKRSRTRDQ